MQPEQLKPLIVETPTRIAGRAFGDERRLTQVLLNL